MSIKEELVRCFQDTIELTKRHPILAAATSKAVESTELKMPLSSQEALHVTGQYTASVEVVEDTSFHTAEELVKDGFRVAVLNFASAVNPGGGVTVGAMAQEECLCRSSNLFPCLKQARLMKDYYMPHRIAGDPFYSDKVIYSKDVTVFKTDDTVPVIMPENEWFKVDVITCAAPNLNGLNNVDESLLSRVLFNRITSIMQQANLHNVNALVLGAFGCGAFKNPPELVSKAFRQAIETNFHSAFERIVFAIKKSDNSNFSVFCRELAPADDTVGNNSAENTQTDSAEASGAVKEQKIGKPISRDDFEKWRQDNPYNGKYFSVLGDSISALEGTIPEGYKPFYTASNSNATNVCESSDIWWGKVIDYVGAKLLVNSSFSGSRVSSQDGSFPAGISRERITSLAKDGRTPDVIIVNLGFNDWAYGVPLKAVAKSKIPITSYFDFSYFNMLLALEKEYPQAEIWCMTLDYSFMPSNMSFQFPFVKNGVHIDAFNNVIRNAAKDNSRRLIDVYSNSMPYSSVDGSHPDADGMMMLARSVCLCLMGDSEMIVEEFFSRQTEDTEAVPELADTRSEPEKASANSADTKEYKQEKENEEETADKAEDEAIGQIVETENTQEEIEEQQNSEEKNSSLIKCSKCGAILQPEFKFCLKCGTPTKHAQTEKSKPADEPVPEIIDDRYKIIRQVGRGASSRVFLAQDIKLDRVCAVKMINKNTYANKMAAQESLDEANKLKHLAHISIPQLYDIFDDEKMLCIVLEFIEGKNLNEMMSATQEPVDERTVINWFMQLCRVLYYLHTLNPPRIFRDLKPANIIAQPNGVLKLIDFGTMKTFDPTCTQDTVNLGTKGYAAPEQYGGKGASDERTDIYGLGMTMYHIVTGINPSANPFEIKPISDFRSDISPQLIKIIEKCTRVEREERYQKVLHILRDLEEI